MSDPEGGVSVIVNAPSIGAGKTLKSIYNSFSKDDDNLKKKPMQRYIANDPDMLVARDEYHKRYKKVQRLSQRMRMIRVANFVIAMVSVAASIVAAEQVYWNRLEVDFHSLGQDDLSDATKVLSTIFTLLLCAGIFDSNYTSFHILKLKNKVVPGQNFFTSHHFTVCLIELVMASIHCPAGVYANLVSRNPQGLVIIYDWDSLLSVAMLFLRMRIGVIIALNETLGSETLYVRIIVKTMRIRLESYFAARTLLETKPIVTNLSVYAIAVIMLAYAIRVAERPVCVQMPSNGPASGCPWKDFESPYNALWCILVTSLTVGYGDLYPVTHMGRFITVVSAVLGIVLIALVVTAVANLARFNADEERGRILLERRSLAADRRHLAGRVVAECLLFRRDRVRAAEKISPTIASDSILVSPRDSAELTAKRKVVVFGPPTPASVRRFAAVIQAWHIHGDDWLKSHRSKSVSDEVKKDIDELKDSNKSIHAKLDALLSSHNLHLVKKTVAPQDFGPNTEFTPRDNHDMD